MILMKGITFTKFKKFFRFWIPRDTIQLNHLTVAINNSIVFEPVKIKKRQFLQAKNRFQTELCRLNAIVNTTRK